VAEKDFRIRMDITLPPTAANHSDEIRDALIPFLQYGVVINQGQPTEERGYIEIERCGHRFDPPQPCEVIAKWVVGEGRVI
jgi:hypothetical protein